jgi:hypothetical protein
MGQTRDKRRGGRNVARGGGGKKATPRVKCHITLPTEILPRASGKGTGGAILVRCGAHIPQHCKGTLDRHSRPCRHFGHAPQSCQLYDRPGSAPASAKKKSLSGPGQEKVLVRAGSRKKSLSWPGIVTTKNSARPNAAWCRYATFNPITMRCLHVASLDTRRGKPEESPTLSPPQKSFF